jgi:thiamine biosynthesis protein ThiS
MHITLNGEQRELARPMTISSLLKELGVDTRRVAVEVNRRILKRTEFDEVSVREGDQLEVVHFVGGGVER